MLNVLFVVIGLVSGSLISLIGTGAGLIIIPALMYFAHFSAKMAIGTSITLLLPPVGMFAAYTYWKHGQVNARAGLLIIIGFLVGSYIMARYANTLPSSTLSKAFGVAAIAIGVRMLF